MNFRITTLQMVSRAITANQRHLQNIGRAQLQTTTGLRINTPSDDPLATRSILSHRTLDQRIESDRNNIQQARKKLDGSVSRLLDAKNMLVKAKSVALESPQTTERSLLATEIDQILDHLIDLANDQFDGHYLFSGSAVNTRPFNSRLTGDTRVVEYDGADFRTQMVVGIDLEVDVLYRGDEIFQPQDREQTLVLGKTGATSGLGTDSATGRGSLVVTHTDTSYAGGSGVSPGTSSADGDTILGTTGTHQLTLVDTSGDGSSGTVSLNGGTPVTFSASDTNLLVTGPEGEIVYLDTTSISAGFNGTVDIIANGVLSVDGGATATIIDFSENQWIEHGESGEGTNIDSRGITRAGVDRLHYVGTADVFQTLSFLADDLRDQTIESNTEWHESVSRTIGDFDRIINHIVSVIGEQSVSLEALETMEARYEVIQLESRGIIADLESADIAEVVLDLQTEQQLLQFTYATTSVLFDQNLLDFI